MSVIDPFEPKLPLDQFAIVKGGVVTRWRARMQIAEDQWELSRWLPVYTVAQFPDGSRAPLTQEVRDGHVISDGWTWEIGEDRVTKVHGAAPVTAEYQARMASISAQS